MALKSTELVFYSVHGIPLTVLQRKSQWLIDNIHTLVGVLPVCFSNEEVEEGANGEEEEISMYGFMSSTTVPVERGVYAIGDSKRRERRIRVLRKAMTVVVRPLQGSELKGFEVRTHELME